MRNLLAILTLVACGKLPPTTLPASPAAPVVVAAPAAPVVQPPTVAVVTAPTPVVVVTPPVVVVTQPVITSLYCYSNGDVYCTGNDVGTGVERLDLETMLIGPTNPFNEQINVISVVNEADATKDGICAEPYLQGCMEHSVCVTIGLFVPGQRTVPYQRTLCGTSFKELSDE